jgi:hypothetical protein
MEERFDRMEMTLNNLKRQKDKIVVVEEPSAPPTIPKEQENVVFNKAEFDTYMSDRFNNDLDRILRASKNKDEGFDWVYKFR